MEFVYVVPREDLFPESTPQGLVPFGPELSCAVFEATVRERGFFVERAHAERDPRLKQIIPYSMVLCGERILLLRRLRKGGESRLFDKLSIGVGGHVDPIDAEAATGFPSISSRDGVPRPAGAPRPAGLLAAATRREVEEELLIDGTWSARPVGILNDDSNAVGAVHVGLVQCVQVDGTVAIREKDQLEGEFVSTDELRDRLAHGADFETWSGLLVAHVDELLPAPAVSTARHGISTL